MASAEEGICMKYELLQNRIEEYKADLERNPGKHSQEWQDRNELCLFYQGHTSNTLSNIDEEGLLEYLSPLWSMLIWGNKSYIPVRCWRTREDPFDEVWDQLQDKILRSIPAWRPRHFLNGFSAFIRGLTAMVN